jgi:molecular chaperone GrpE (heat shock protein)
MASMNESVAPKLSKWPFLLGDALLLGMAFFIARQCHFTLGHWEMCFVVLCVLGGAVLGIAPFILEYEAQAKVAEAGALTTVAAQLENLQAIATQITGATGRWQDAQDAAEKTSQGAREIAERMTAEVQSFADFMKRSSDSERANLRLEVEKLRRVESDWLQVLVRVMDHVYAVNVGAARSGQANLVQQMGSFQNACRDAARRVGLTPFVASESEPFDPQRHQLVEDGAKPPPDALVGETIATGYTFQGKLVRPALVRLANGVAPATPIASSAGDQQSSLPLDASVPSPQ